MRLDRAEWTGTGAALAFHVVLIGALSMSLASVDSTPESPAMEVEFVEEVGLTAAAPQAVAAPPPPSQAPEIGEAEPTEPAPVIQPDRTPTKPAPVIQPARTPTITPAPAKPQQPARPAPRVSRIGDDFLKGIGDDDAPRAAPAQPAAPAYNATARASIGQSIIRQAQRCADRQPFIGEDANKVRLRVNLKLTRTGRLARPPAILGSAGDPELRDKYGQLLADQVRRIFADCSPFRLPPDLYDTPDGGWKDFTFTYRVN